MNLTVETDTKQILTPQQFTIQDTNTKQHERFFQVLFKPSFGWTRFGLSRTLSGFSSSIILFKSRLSCAKEGLCFGRVAQQRSITLYLRQWTWHGVKIVSFLLLVGQIRHQPFCVRLHAQVCKCGWQEWEKKCERTHACVVAHWMSVHAVCVDSYMQVGMYARWVGTYARCVGTYARCAGELMFQFDECVCACMHDYVSLWFGASVSFLTIEVDIWSDSQVGLLLEVFGRDAHQILREMEQILIMKNQDAVFDSRLKIDINYCIEESSLKSSLSPSLPLSLSLTHSHTHTHSLSLSLSLSCSCSKLYLSFPKKFWIL